MNKSPVSPTIDNKKSLMKFYLQRYARKIAQKIYPIKQKGK
jgi:hypothetical protein